jgi:predicted RNase H-like HicB family nuclease
MKYRVTLIESEEGWAVWCDDLPGCCSQGTTRQEALDNIREALQEYLAALAENPGIKTGQDVKIVHHEEVLV